MIPKPVVLKGCRAMFVLAKAASRHTAGTVRGRKYTGLLQHKSTQEQEKKNIILKINKEITKQNFLNIVCI